MAPIPPSLFVEDDYVAPPFILPTIIDRNKRIPRGGKINNITTIVAEDTNKDDVKEYVKGILFAAILMLVLFFVWAIILLVFKCIGRKRVGVLSGWPPKIKHTSTPQGEALGVGNSTELQEIGRRQAEEGNPNNKTHVVTETSVTNNDLLEEEANVNDADDNDDGDNISWQNESSDHDKESTSDLDSNSVACFNGEVDMFKAQKISTSNGITDEASENETNDTDMRSDENEAMPSTLKDATDHDIDSNLNVDPNSAECLNDVEDVDNSMWAKITTQAKSNWNTSDPYINFDDSCSLKNEEKESDEKKLKRTHTMLLLSRIVVLGSCLIIIISSIMFLDNGIASLKKSLKNVEKGMNQVEDVAEDGINIIDSFVTDLEGAQSYVEDFLAGDIISCVEKIVSKTCNVTDNDKLSMFEMENFTAECDVSDVLESVENIRNRYLTLNQGISEEVVNTRSDLVEIVEITHNLEKTVHSFNWAFYVAAALSILLDLVVSLLAYGIVQAWRGQIRSLYNCCRGGFLLPFFILNVLLMWISASVFLVGAVVTSDFCYTSPDPMVEIVLDNNADRFTSLTYQFSRYVLKGCSDTTNPITIGLDDLAKKFFSISSILRSIHYLINWIISEDTEQLEALCGQEISPMISFLEFLDLEFHSLLNTAEAVRELFFCENWHPIYTYIVHDALCYDGVKGMTWVYCTLSTIGFFGMVVLTLRFTMFLEEDGKESSADAAEIVEDDASTQ